MTSATFLCSTCSASFETNQIRREHMRESWHVFNMQRKVAELPSISLESYNSLIGEPDLETRIDRSRISARETSAEAMSETCYDDDTPTREDEDAAVRDYTNDDDDTSDHDSLLTEPERCLFCNAVSRTVDDCLNHMQKMHGFRIPDIKKLQTDLDTFLSYLNLVISRFHSCLYCGHEKHSADAVRSHMLGKGHCMLDLSEDSDFLDFWNDYDDNATQGQNVDVMQKLSDTEVRLQSGSVASSRHTNRPTNRPAKSKRQPLSSTALVTTPPSPQANPGPSPSPTPSSSSTGNSTRALAKRSQMGLLGLSDSQHRSLALTHQKLVAREQRFRNEARWTVEKFGNTTKMRHFKPDTPGRKNG